MKLEAAQLRCREHTVRYAGTSSAQGCLAKSDLQQRLTAYKVAQQQDASTSECLIGMGKQVLKVQVDTYCRTSRRPGVKIPVMNHPQSRELGTLPSWPAYERHSSIRD